MILLAHSYFLGHDPKQLARGKPYPPLATLLTASLLREHGFQPALFDAMLASGVHEFEAMLDDVRPRIVGILEDNFNFLTKMCTVRMREATLAMTRAAHIRGCRVAVNGSDATDRCSLYLDAGADAVILGNGDAAFLELAQLWSREPDASPAGVPGVVFSNGRAGPSYGSPRQPRRELDSLPFPAWDLVDANAYRRVWTTAHQRFSWNMAASRGCPFGCNWCAKPVFGRGYVQRSAQSVAEEMRRLKEAIAPDHVWFADDIFGLTEQWIVQFAREVAHRDARIPFMIQSRVDLMRPATTAALANAGCEEVWMGVESGSQKILDAMDKGSTIGEVRAGTRALKSSGVRACWFIQLGYPSETWDDLLKTRDLIRDERPDDIGVSVAYPLPGTPFYAKVRAQLGDRQNWDTTGDLAMLFHGTYTTDFYHRVRDVLHAEVRSGDDDDLAWARLEHDEALSRTDETLLVTGS